MKNIPNKIYLQVDPENEKPEFFVELGTTWCSDRINDNDIPYYRKQVKVEPEVMVNFAEEIDKMLKNIEEYFETPNYKNNVVEYKSYYDGAYYYLKQLKNILIMKSKIST